MVVCVCGGGGGGGSIKDDSFLVYNTPKNFFEKLSLC